MISFQPQKLNGAQKITNMIPYLGAYIYFGHLLLDNTFAVLLCHIATHLYINVVWNFRISLNVAMHYILGDRFNLILIWTSGNMYACSAWNALPDYVT